MDISNFDLSVIYTRPDGSYLLNQGIYHVPNEGEWIDLWKQVEEYVKAHPEVVKAEPTPPEPTLEELKDAKLSELASKFTYMEEHAYLTSSLGIVINAGTKADRDIDGLIKLLTAKPEIEMVNFCCHDNTETPVTLADLKTMQIEVILSGNALYQQKWDFRKAINAAQSKEELDAVVIAFTMMDFTK